MGTEPVGTPTSHSISLVLITVRITFPSLLFFLKRKKKERKEKKQTKQKLQPFLLLCLKDKLKPVPVLKAFVSLSQTNNQP